MAEMFLQISVSLDGFAEGGIRRYLRLTGSESFSSGATLHRYRFA
jgi:hypothetical protein